MRRNDPQIQQAVGELRTLIHAHYPDAICDVFEREDPHGVRLRVTVDLDDTDPVIDVVMDALHDIQVERALPIYVVTEQPLARVAEQLRARRTAPPPVGLPPLMRGEMG
jgi:hypothetical protein